MGLGIIGYDPLQGMTCVEDVEVAMVLAHESGERACIHESRVTPVCRSIGLDESKTVSCFVLPGGMANPCVVIWQVAWKIDRMIV